MSEANASLVDGVVARIEDDIITGRLVMGSRLGEQALADRLGVSRGPLREALRRLEGRRLIVRKHNVGATVAEVTAEALTEMLLVREALEGMAARLAATAMSDKEIRELEKLVAVQIENERSAEHAPDYQSPQLDFHLRIVRGSRNQQLHDILYTGSLNLLRIFRYRSTSQVAVRPPHAMAEHRAIVAAIAAREPHTAETAMRAHLANAHANILANVLR